MQKFLFLNRNELSEQIRKIYLARGEELQAETSFCEETEADIVILTKINSIESVILADLLNDLSEHFGVQITHYDEMEVGDFGVGFLFFI